MRKKSSVSGTSEILQSANDSAKKKRKDKKTTRKKHNIVKMTRKINQ